MKLVSMIDFVLKKEELTFNTIDEYNNSRLINIERYATFLSQPLNLGMFVPAIEVNGKWEVLEEPPHYNEKISFFDGKIIPYKLIKQVEQYQQAKDRVLFEGLTLDSVERLLLSCETVEDLLDNYYRYITLTAKGQELSGLNK